MRLIGVSILLGALDILLAASLWIQTPALLIVAFGLRIGLGLPLEALLWCWAAETAFPGAPFTRKLPALTLLLVYVHAGSLLAGLLTCLPGLLLAWLVWRAGLIPPAIVLLALTLLVGFAGGAAARGVLLRAPAAYLLQQRPLSRAWRAGSSRHGARRRIFYSLLAAAGRLVGAVAGLIGAILAPAWLTCAIILDMHLPSMESPP